MYGRCLLFALVCLPATAPAVGAEEGRRPAYQFLRQEEDWSTFREAPDFGSDLFDPVKHVPLSEDGAIWASFGGSVRGRVEGWLDFAFGAPDDDDDVFALGRMFLHGDLHLGSTVRLFLELKTAGATDRDLPGGRRTLDVDQFDFQQGFLELNASPGDRARATLRLGRQAFLYGRQRLVSPLPWANTLRSWDGALARLRFGSWTIDGFWSAFARVRKHTLNRPSIDEQFAGLYASGRPAEGPATVELYALGRFRDDPIAWNGSVGHDDRATLGARVASPLGCDALTLDAEGAYQVGRVGDEDVSAFMLAAELAYKAADWWSAPRFALSVDYASGDHSPGGDVQTFDQLYPLGHAYFGYMDFVGRQNIFDLSPAVTVAPGFGFTLHVAGHYFRRADRDDALYNAGGGVVRPGGPGTPHEVGGEIDVVIKRGFGRHLVAEVGYGHFFAGDFIEATGPDEDMDFLYAQLQYRF